MLETSHLRCFVAVAQELHFSRAAERLNMTQPPLSRQIRLLEHTMKCELFHRNSRSVKLTHAGSTFLPEAQRILRIMETAVVSAQDVAAGRKGIVRCGFTASAAYELLPLLVSQLQKDLPEVALSLSEMVSREQSAALVSGEIEIGLLRALSDLESYEHRVVARERLVVALPQAHPLASRASLKWSDLHQERFLGYEPMLGQYFHNLITTKMTAEGIKPNYVQDLSQIHSILALIHSGTGISVVPQSAEMLAIKGVVYRPIDDPSPVFSELYIVWHPENKNPLVPIIAELAYACSSANR